MPPGISTSDFYYILPELVITAGALLVLVADVVLPRDKRGMLGWLTLGVLAITFYSLTPFRSTQIEVAHGLIAVDRFAIFFKIVFLIAAGITVLMSMRYLEIEGASPGEYYFLAGFIKPNQRSNEAAVKYFLLGAFSLGILLYGMSLMYGLSGTTNLRAMATAFVGQETDPRLVLAVILVVAGIGFKIAAVPFHMWAPDVYEGAPTPVTAFLSVGSKAASFAMLLRIFLEGLPAVSADWTLLFYALSVVTMTIGNLAALTQSNLKRMLAYSSIAHAGYLLIGVVAAGAGYPRGVTAALVYLFIYAFMQLGAFGIIVLMRRQDVIGDELKDLSGLYLRRPVAAFAMLLFMLSLGGIPPTAGFMGKFWLFSAAIEAGFVWLAVIGVLNSAISLYYYIRVVVFMYLKKDATTAAPVFSPALAFAVGLAIAGTILLGVYPRVLFDVADASARTLGAV